MNRLTRRGIETRLTTQQLNSLSQRIDLRHMTRGVNGSRSLLWEVRVWRRVAREMAARDMAARVAA